jgi:hypothetical protein
MEYVSGGISIGSTLFANSLKLYQLIQATRNAGSTFQQQYNHLQVLEIRYQLWGEQVGLDKETFNAQELGLTPAQVNLVLDILAKVSESLLEASKLEAPYLAAANHEPQDEHPESPLVNNAAIYARQLALQKAAKKPGFWSCFKFAIDKKDKFDSLVVKLTEAMEQLEFCTGRYRKKLEGILLVKALLSESPDALARLASIGESEYGTLSRLSLRRQKFLEIYTEQQGSGNTSLDTDPSNNGFELNHNHFDLPRKEDENPSGRDFGTYKSIRPVIAEWKVAADGFSQRDMIQRACGIAKFLSTSSEEDSTHIQKCIG